MSEKLPLFSVLMDYRGGTYVSQLRSATVGSAIAEWAEALVPSTVAGMSAESQVALARDVCMSAPVAVEGMRSAWCTSSNCTGHQALIHIIRTEILDEVQ